MESQISSIPAQSERIRKLSILIPVYNERRTLKTLLDKVLAAPLPCERELVIVDDCSTDGSREYLVEFARLHPENVKLILHKKNSGKGTGIRTAIRHFTGDWAIIQDADLEYDPNEYERLLAPIQDGVADAVFGSRFMAGRYRRAMYFWHTMVNNTLTLASNVLNDLNLTDMETCYKVVRGDILKNLVIRSRGFDLEPELTTKLARWGARIYEVPISYRGRSYAEGKKIGPKDAYFAIRAMIKYRFFDPKYTKHDGFLILQAVRRARQFNRWMFSQIEKYIGDNVLEAGCGIGNLTEMLLDRKRLVAVDYEDFYVDRIAQAYGHLENLEVGRADLTEKVDIDRAANGKPFDTIICLNVIEHIREDETVLRNFYSSLAPGGRAIILVPHDPTLYSAVDKTLGHFRRYTRKELASKMESAGFRVLRTWGFNRVGGLGWRISGKVLRKKTLSAGQMGWFEWLMPLIRMVEHIPFHSHTSVICVGEKPLDSESTRE
jgi:glycosyltransferase involved in cell wall biosynthesis